MNAREEAPVRLTHFSHDGGCGCKIAPAVLEQILAKSGSSLIRPELLVALRPATTRLCIKSTIPRRSLQPPTSSCRRRTVSVILRAVLSSVLAGYCARSSGGAAF